MLRFNLTSCELGKRSIYVSPIKYLWDNFPASNTIGLQYINTTQALASKAVVGVCGYLLRPILDTLIDKIFSRMLLEQSTNIY